MARAADLFADSGYDGVSVREIVEAAGVTKPVLYYHFGSKEGLARAILQDLLAERDARRRSALSSAKDVREALAGTAEGLIRLALERKGAVVFAFSIWFGSTSLKELLAHANEHDCAVKDEWLEFLGRHGIGAVAAGRIVRSFWALMLHEVIKIGQFPDVPVDPVHLANEIAGLVLDGAMTSDTEQR
ncbi:MAG: TetR/AcrR family transcriptional regulator [Nitrospira sp.]|nr:TetR/AcrR family transcriptional regulator [Nitrospira sp.]